MPVKSNQEVLYDNLVSKKYNLYNSIFLNLPFKDIRNTGTLIPILFMECEKGYQQNKSPKQILDHFFEKHTDFNTEEERIDFMFRVIQYVERQVVLFDAVEESSFKNVNALSNNRGVSDILKSEMQAGNMEEVMKLLNEFSVRLVFTAHPTQFYPLTVLDIINDLRNEVAQDDIESIDRTLQQLGLTSFIQKEKPTPLEEALNIIYYLRNVYYEAIGHYYEEILNHTRQYDFQNPNLLRIGFWPGGDRDGNPYVTTKITMEVAKELRSTLMKCYYNDTKKLHKKLTFDKTLPIIKRLRNALYNSIFSSKKSVPYQRILKDLKQVSALLKKDYNNLYQTEVQQLINKVEIFKNHFATIDIRQNHSVHEQIILQILKSNQLIKESIEELSKEKLNQVLFNEPLNTKNIVFENDENGVLQDTFNNFKTIAKIQKEGGEEACNRYIISNSENENAVLFVLALFHIQGYKAEEIKVDIVPLFETMIGMRESENIMNNLFHHPVYAKHLEQRNRHQTIMLGFSDGTKDGGYLKANWSIFKTKEKLSELCKQNEIEVFFFDGRGGPPARGGGKTYRFYAAQSDRIENNDIELTIQGQTITSTYGTQDQFLYNCDQMLAAGLQNHLEDKKQKEISDQHRALIEELSEISFQAYQDLKNDPQFLPYLEKMSTLHYYGKANIGSRPGKRGQKKELTLEDLRAISFVGAWSQLKQNVPGYYGIGSALSQIKKEDRLEEVKSLWQEVPFFNALMKNSMMSLEKSYFNLTHYIAENSEFTDFWNRLHREYQLTRELLLEISDYDELMQEEPLSKASIGKREHIVLPLLTIQQYALQSVHNESEFNKVYQKLVIRSLYGNINASRNSA